MRKAPAAGAQRREELELAPNLHAFLWRDTRANNCNTYLITGRIPILVDPGHAAFLRGIEEELALLRMSTRDLGLVLLTHGHPDHLEGAAAFSPLPARVAIHEEEATFVAARQDSLYRAQGMNPPDLAFDFFLREGSLRVGEHEFHVLHAPGHSPGSACLYWPERKVLITGDVVFYQGVGRTDLPGGNGKKLKESILRLAELDVEWLLPGHGSPVKGREAVKKNFETVQRVYFDYI